MTREKRIKRMARLRKKIAALKREEPGVCAIQPEKVQLMLRNFLELFQEFEIQKREDRDYPIKVWAEAEETRFIALADSEEIGRYGLEAGGDDSGTGAGAENL